MTVYVDDMRRPALARGFLAEWSHLLADTHTELVNFAVGQLKLNWLWIQHEGTHREHFDVTEYKRREAIRYGAIPISYLKETPALLKAKKHGQVFDLTALRAEQ